MSRSAATIFAALVFLVPELCLAGTITVAVISDMNGRYGSKSYSPSVAKAVARIIQIDPDVVLSTGDMIAGQRLAPKLTEDELTAMWQSFHATVSGPLTQAGIPIAATPGNHDGSAYVGFEAERRRYALEWPSLPPQLEMVDAGTFPFAYAFSFDDVLFISLDATAVGALPQEQMAWLEALLMRSQGQYRAEIVFSHLPLWPFAVGRESEVIGDSALATLFREMGIDLHLSGHHHAFYPGAANGVLYVAQSCLGGGVRTLIGTGEKAPRSFTVVEIADDGSIMIRAYETPDFVEQVDFTTLPERIVSALATIERADLARQVRTSSR